MEKYKELTKDIPWNSSGRETIISNVARSLVPVGVLPFTPLSQKDEKLTYITNESPDIEKYLMNIVGTSIQAGQGKLVTCRHVVEGIVKQEKRGYILARLLREGLVAYTPYPVQKALKYVDPRTEQVNQNVDLSVLIVPAKSTEQVPYEVPNIEWGDSSQLGVGDPVIVGGFPYGTDMFKFTQSNRGIIQPTFYNGIISSILPATNSKEVRILQISVASAGGMSGGAVIEYNSGNVVGMITSCVHINGIPQPISYAIPSEIIAPYVEIITFETK